MCLCRSSTLNVLLWIVFGNLKLLRRNLQLLISFVQKQLNGSYLRVTDEMNKAILSLLCTLPRNGIIFQRAVCLKSLIHHPSIYESPAMYTRHIKGGDLQGWFHEVEHSPLYNFHLVMQHSQTGTPFFHYLVTVICFSAMVWWSHLLQETKKDESICWSVLVTLLRHAERQKIANHLMRLNCAIVR